MVTIIVTASVSIFRPISVRAQESPPEALAPSAPPLEQLEKLALQHAPSLPAPYARYAAPRSRISPAQAFPDPYLELSGVAMGVSPPAPSSSLTLEYRQDLPYPGKRDARQSAAQAEAQVAFARIGEARARVVEEVRVAYAQIFAFDGALRALQSAKKLVDTMSNVAAARYAAGQSSRGVLLNVSIRAARLRQKQAEIEADRSVGVSELNRLIGRPYDSPLGEVVDLPPAPSDKAQTLFKSLERSPDVVLAEAEYTAASRRVQAVRMEERPDFVVGAGGGVDWLLEPVIMVRVGMQLPLWGGAKQSKLTEAEAYGSQAARYDVEDTRARVRTEVARLYAEWTKFDAVAREYTTSIIPDSAAAFEAALSAYVSGQGDFSAVLEDFDAVLEARTMLVSAQADRFIAWARLKRLTSAASTPNSNRRLP
jgi:cobalt-zinc-cadmium efflux system outer membrane protein